MLFYNDWKLSNQNIFNNNGCNLIILNHMSTYIIICGCNNTKLYYGYNNYVITYHVSFITYLYVSGCFQTLASGVFLMNQI